MKKVLWQTFALLIVASMILVACGTPAPVAEAPAADVRKLFDGNTPPPAGQELTDALAGKYKGKVVTMAGPSPMQMLLNSMTLSKHLKLPPALIYNMKVQKNSKPPLPSVLTAAMRPTLWISPSPVCSIRQSKRVRQLTSTLSSAPIG